MSDFDTRRFYDPHTGVVPSPIEVHVAISDDPEEIRAEDVREAVHEVNRLKGFLYPGVEIGDCIEITNIADGIIEQKKVQPLRGSAAKVHEAVDWLTYFSTRPAATSEYDRARLAERTRLNPERRVLSLYDTLGTAGLLPLIGSVSSGHPRRTIDTRLPEKPIRFNVPEKVEYLHEEAGTVEFPEN